MDELKLMGPALRGMKALPASGTVPPWNATVRLIVPPSVEGGGFCGKTSTAAVEECSGASPASDWKATSVALIDRCVPASAVESVKRPLPSVARPQNVLAPPGPVTSPTLSGFPTPVSARWPPSSGPPSGSAALKVTSSVTAPMGMSESTRASGIGTGTMVPTGATPFA